METAHDDGDQSAQSPPAFGAQVKHHLRRITANMPTFGSSGSSARGRSSLQKDANQLGRTSWRGIVCGFSHNERSSFRVWNPRTCRAVESRKIVLIDTPPDLLFLSRRLPPLQGLKSSTFDFNNNSLDDNYSSRKDTAQDAKGYTSALDFDANTPPRILTPGDSSPGGAEPQE